jgi:hypothetical protein
LQNSFLGCVQIFPGALVRSLQNYVGGHMNSLISNRSAFVGSLQGIVLPKIHFDGKIAEFSNPLIFEFCNTIKVLRTWTEARRRPAWTRLTQTGPRRGNQFALQQKLARLLDHLVGGGEECLGNAEAKCPGGFQIDSQFEFCRLEYR